MAANEAKRSRLLKVAQTNWSGVDEPRFSKKVLSDVLNYVVESNYSIDVVRLLGKTGFLELYLWPFYEEKSPEFHVELIALVVAAKDAYGEDWTEIVDDKFGSFVDRVLRILLGAFDEHTAHLLAFLRACLSQIGAPEVRKQIGRLVSIPIWSSLPEETVAKIIEANPHLKRPWKGSQKKLKVADEAVRHQMEFERGWLASLVMNLGAVLAKQTVSDKYLAAFAQFITSLVGKVPTRRYTNTVLKDLHLVTILRAGKVRSDLVDLVERYVYMPFNDYIGEPLTEDEAWQAHIKRVDELQTVAFRDYRQELHLLALATPESVETDMEDHLVGLTDDQLRQLAEKLHIRHKYPKKVVGKKAWRGFVAQCFAQAYKRPVRPLRHNRLPTESDLYSPLVDRLVSQEQNDGELALPELSSQCLSVPDLAARVFQLDRLELLAYMRQEIELIVKRMKPENVAAPTNSSSAGSKRRRDGEAVIEAANSVKFTGYSKLASRLNNPPAMLVETPPILDTSGPGYVRVELDLDLDSRANAFWDDLKPGQYIYLVHGQPEVPPVKTLRLAKVDRLIRQGDKSSKKDEGGQLEKLVVDVDPTRFEFGKENGETQRLEAVNLVVKPRPELLTLMYNVQALEELEVPHRLSPLIENALLGIQAPEEESTETPSIGMHDDTGLREDEIAVVQQALSKKLALVKLPLRPDTEVHPAVALLRHLGDGRTLVISASDRVLGQVFSELEQSGSMLSTDLLHFTPDEHEDSSRPGTIAYFMHLRAKLLAQVEDIAAQISVAGAFGDSCATGIYFLTRYREQLLSLTSEQVGEDALHRLCAMLTALKPLELPTSSGFESMRRNYFMHNPARIVGMTGEAYALAPERLKAEFSAIVFLSSSALREAHTLLPLVRNHSSATSIAMFGDNSLGPWVRSNKLRRVSHLATSLFGRLTAFSSVDSEGLQERLRVPNAGFEYPVQFIKTRDYARSGKHARTNGDESEPSPQFVQNVGEAEYAVALFQYMRLLEYPADSISVVTTTSGQKELIQSLFRGIAASSEFAFGEPTVHTVRESGPSDYVILSLVRTSGLGFDDEKEAQYACAQGRKGVYILGDWDLYRHYEPFSVLGDTAGDLRIVTNELHPIQQQQQQQQQREGVAMQGLGHLVQYVQQMTDQRINYERVQ